MRSAGVFAAVAVFAGLCATRSAQGQIVNESLKLLADDGAVGDWFGYATAIDNGKIVVGAPFDDDLGGSSGSAYVFDVVTGAQITKLLPDDGVGGDQFGYAVAMDAGVIAVGARGDGSTSAGSVYLFDAVTGVQFEKLTASDAAIGDQFGFSVAIDSGVVVVGAYWNDDLGNKSGAAYLFEVDTGVEIAKLLPSDGEARDQFGVSVAIEDGLVVIGANTDDGSDTNTGSAYVFDAVTGAEITKLTAFDEVKTGEFGFSVAISSGLIAIGARGDDDNGLHSGSVYLFDAFTGFQIGKLISTDGANSSEFGYSVAINAGVVAIGALSDSIGGSSTGAAALFDAYTSDELTELEPVGGLAGGDFFGTSIASQATHIAVGSPFDDDNGSNSGSVYLFELPGSCLGDIADDLGTLPPLGGPDGMVSFGDFLAMLGLIGACPGGVPGCTGDIADTLGTIEPSGGPDGSVSFGDFLALLGLVGLCP